MRLDGTASAVSSSARVLDAAAGPRPSGTLLTLQVGGTSLTIQQDGLSRTVALDAPPVLAEGRTFLPIRPVVEALGGSILWIPAERRIDITQGSVGLRLWIGRATAEKNGAAVPIDPGNASVKPYVAPPGRTMLPLRFVAENLGAKVNWLQSSGTITIETVAGLEGVVVNALSGQTIPGAKVTCGQQTATSDNTGVFSFSSLPAGTAVLRASASGYRPGETSYDYQPGTSAPALVGLWPKAVQEWEATVSAKGGCVVEAGEGLAVVLPEGAAPAGASLQITEYDGGPPGEGVAFTVDRAYDITLGAGQQADSAGVSVAATGTGEDGPGSVAPGLDKPATLEFTVPTGEDAAQALILCYEDGEWYIAADASRDEVILGGEVSKDGRTISIQVEHFSSYAVAFIRPDIVKAFPVNTTVESRRVNADGNLEVTVVLEQPRHLLGFIGTWYEVTVEDALNLISVICPSDGLFGDNSGYLAPGETKRLVLTFYGVGGRARITYDMQGALGMMGADWLCRLATGSKLPWPLSAEKVLSLAVDPLIQFASAAGWLTTAPGALAAIGAYTGTWMSTTHLHEVVDRIGTNIIKYAAEGSGANIDAFYSYLGRAVGQPGNWAPRPYGTPGAWKGPKVGNLWWRFISTSDLSVSTMVMAILGYEQASYNVVGATWPKVTVEPAEASVGSGQTVKFTAKVTDPGGTPVTYPRVEWSADGGGTIDSIGQFAAGKSSSGVFTVTASVTGVDFAGSPHESTGSAKVRTGPIPAQLGAVADGTISCGGSHGLLITSEGKVVSWGNNEDGQLGNGQPAAFMTAYPPMEVVGLDDVVQVAAGPDFSLARKSDGTVWAWGDNESGQLGIGSDDNVAVPTKVQNLPPCTYVAASSGASFAVASDGALWGWGDDAYCLPAVEHGQPIAPTPVAGVSGVVAVAPSGGFVLALTADGSVWAWGHNMFGQVGQPARVFVPSPGPNWYVAEPSRVEGLADVVAIAAGDSHSLALTSDGTLYTWGNNLFGQLGYEEGLPWDPSELTGYYQPKAVEAIGPVSAIAAGSFSSVAVTSDGLVLVWGGNWYSERLEEGYSGFWPAPVRVTELTGVTAVSAWNDWYMAGRADGSVWTWGFNWRGCLGRESGGLPAPLAMP